jgi:protease I
MAKALFLIVPDGFRDEEYSIPKEIFEQKGIEVVTGSTVTGELTGKKGLTTATVNVLLKDVSAQDYACVVIVGGQQTFWNNEILIKLLKEMHQQKKPIGAICSSAVLPAQAGLLTGQKATAFPGDEELAELKKYQAIYTGNPVEIANNIITGSGPAAAEDFARQIITILPKESVNNLA